MKKSINNSTIIIGLLVIAIVSMSVGFAVFAQNLNLEGTAVVKTSNWSIHFDTDSYKESTGSVTVSADKLDVAATTMSYEVTLGEPGDFYEFTINAVNDGSFDANLTAITLSSLSDTQSKYLTYKLYYNGTEYTTTNPSITGVSLNSGDTSPVKVRVEYVQPADPADLPDADQTITLNATLSYTQKAA